MSFHAKLLRDTKQPCSYCFDEKGVVNTMYLRNLQRHTDRSHPGKNMKSTTEEYIRQRQQELAEEQRINNEMLRMQQIHEENVRLEASRQEEERMLKEKLQHNEEEKIRIQKLQQEKEEKIRIQKLQHEEENRLQNEKLQQEEKERLRNEKLQKEEEERQTAEKLKKEAEHKQHQQTLDILEEQEADNKRQRKSVQNTGEILPKEFPTKHPQKYGTDSDEENDRKRLKAAPKKQPTMPENVKPRVLVTCNQTNKQTQSDINVGNVTNNSCISNDHVVLDVSEKNNIRVNKELNLSKRQTCETCFGMDISNVATKSDLAVLGSEMKKIFLDVADSLKRQPQNTVLSQTSNVDLESFDVALPNTDKISLIRNAKSMEDLLRYAPDFEKWETGLACKPCKLNHNSIERTKIGSIRYNFNDDDNYINKKQPKQFSNLKTRVLEHMQSGNHSRSKSMEDIYTKLDAKEQEKNYTAGMNCVRNAYSCIKLHGSYSQYESLMQIDSEKGVEVGELNHSSNFAHEMTEHFYSTLREQHKEVLKSPLQGTGRPRPFSIVSDKGTPNKDTLHIIGMISQMDNKLQPVLLDIVEARNGTGVGLATDIYKSMKNYFTDDEIKERLVGMSWDGQYFHNHVDRELMNLLNVPEENRMFYAAQYDVSHLLELADKEAREQSSWVAETYKTISELNQKYSYGKSFMELQNQMATMNEEKEAKEKATFKRLKPFCKTRFATYTGGLIEAVRNDFEAIYNHLHSDADPMLNSISNAGFVLRLNGLRDVYATIGQTSKDVQRPNIYSWNLDELVETGSKHLKSMVTSLQSETFEATNAQLKHFNQAVRELRRDETFMGTPITNNKQSYKNLRSHDEQDIFHDTDLEKKIRMVCKEIAGHIEAFNTSFNGKYEKNKAAMCKTDKACFSLDEIINRPTDFVPTEYKQCVELSQRVGYIPPDVTFDDLKKEYNQFTTIVKHKVSKWRESYLDLPIDEQKIYDQLINSELDLKNCRNVGHLLAGATSRSHCEAITEGMGSVVSRQVNNRKSLSTDKLAAETYLAWNGPFPGRAANELLEKSLDKKFKSRAGWHFYRKTKRIDKVKEYEVSKVVDKGSQKMGKIPFS